MLASKLLAGVVSDVSCDGFDLVVANVLGLSLHALDLLPLVVYQGFPHAGLMHGLHETGSIQRSNFGEEEPRCSWCRVGFADGSLLPHVGVCLLCLSAFR